MLRPILKYCQSNFRDIPKFDDKDIPQVTEAEVIEALANMDTSKSNTKDDIPAKILKHFALQLGKPVSDIINTSIRQGCWPNIFKLEVVTPVPKGFPPKNIDELRNISGLLKLDKIAEKIIAKMMINDMKRLVPVGKPKGAQYSTLSGKIY